MPLPPSKNATVLLISSLWTFKSKQALVNFNIMEIYLHEFTTAITFGYFYDIQGKIFWPKVPPGERNKFNLEKNREEIQLEKKNDKC